MVWLVGISPQQNRQAVERERIMADRQGKTHSHNTGCLRRGMSNRQARWVGWPGRHVGGVEAPLRQIVLLAVCLWINCSALLAQRAPCPAIEVSVVADVQSDSNRSIALSDGQQIQLAQVPLLTSADVTGAHVSLTEGQYVLNVDVTVEGAKRVRLFSERNVGRTLAFVVDGHVLRTPTIRDPITGNGFLIGAFERAEAERLADAMNTGCRP